LSSPEEDNFQGEQPVDSTVENKARNIGDEGSATGWDMSASGRAAVWATDNTREAIVDAFQRREVYATTGPHIAVRFDGGWHPSPANSTPTAQSTAQSAAIETTATGAPATENSKPDVLATVPMGSDLPLPAPAEHAPGFKVSAMKDPRGANLDRIQIIKGWVDTQGESHERIFDVAWSGERTPDNDGVLPAVGNTVDITTASYGNTIGEPALEALWRDPEFDPTQSAFYYARVLEIPTPRHSLYDAVALGSDTRTPQPTSLQERAYTSPIWYQPPAHD
jgi:hypothetical protein